MDMNAIKFDERGLVPAIAQDAATGEVLMLAWMNAESLQMTLDTGYATYYSRSRRQLWKKGETSGHTQKLVSIKYDCDGDAILMQVEQVGPACHTGEKTCFHNEIWSDEDAPANASILQHVYDTVVDRAANPQEGSYTNYLLDKGIEKTCKKVGEEASEAIIATMKHNKEEVIYEAADLLYHLTVLLYQNGVTLQDVWTELDKRR